MGDACDPEEWGTTFGCQEVMCEPSPEGCKLLASPVINTDGKCCSRCSSVDSEGNTCNSGSNVAANSWVYFFALVYLYLKW